VVAPGAEKRSGFTLFELVIVMCLIVIALAIIAPVADSLINPNQVTASVDAVRSQWADLRGRAMEEGRPYRFSVQDGSSHFRAEPDDADAVGAAAGVVREGDISDPCIFGQSDGDVQGGDPNGTSSQTAPSGTWRAVAVFLPDGTARADAALVFGRPGLPSVTLNLRALTGSVSQTGYGAPATDQTTAGQNTAGQPVPQAGQGDTLP
jgi:prepilin-type N-terminal cleavage/methylation domain-containing protein